MASSITMTEDAQYCFEKPREFMKSDLLKWETLLDEMKEDIVHSIINDYVEITSNLTRNLYHELQKASADDIEKLRVTNCFQNRFHSTIEFKENLLKLLNDFLLETRRTLEMKMSSCLVPPTLSMLRYVPSAEEFAMGSLMKFTYEGKSTWVPDTVFDELAAFKRQLSEENLSLLFSKANIESEVEVNAEYDSKSMAGVSDKDIVKQSPLSLHGPTPSSDVKQLVLPIPQQLHSKFVKLLYIGEDSIIIAGGTAGLWLVRGTGRIKKIDSRKSWGLCTDKTGSQLFITGFGHGVRRFHLDRGNISEVVGGGFKVEGGNSIITIDASPDDLLAIGNYNDSKVTIHDFKGKVIDKFKVAKAWDVLWLDKNRLCVISRQFPRALLCYNWNQSKSELLWQVDMFQPIFITYINNVVYVSQWDSNVIVGVDSQSGETQAKDKNLVCQGSHALKVHQEDGKLVLLSFNYKKQK